MKNGMELDTGIRVLTPMEVETVKGGVAPIVAAAAKGFAAGVALGAIGKAAEGVVTKVYEAVKSAFS